MMPVAAISYGAPGYFVLLALIPVCIAIAAWWLVWRVGARHRIGVPAEHASRRLIVTVVPLLLIAAIALSAYAAARPQFGERTATGEERGIALVVVLDVSNSMLATDAAPTRLAASQAQIEALVDRMHGSRFGLVIFARQPFVRAPMTLDAHAFREIVAGVDGERALVPAGSDLGAAIRAGTSLLAPSGASESKVILVVSDGEDHAAAIAPAVAEASKAGIRIYAAGAGTAAGAPVRDFNVTTGEMTTRLDANGAPVLTRLDEGKLAALATAGGGRYVRLNDRGGLTSLGAEFSAMPSTLFGERAAPQPIERFGIFAAIALLLVVIELLAPALQSWSRLLRGGTGRLWPLAAVGLLLGAVCSTRVATLNDSGNAAYDRGDYAGALSAYATAEALDPARAEIRSNAGNAYDRAGDYDKAIAETGRALQRAESLRAVLEYGLGNHHAAAGHIADALEAYKRALLADPGDADAKHNLEVELALVPRSLTPAPTAGASRTPDASGTNASQRTPKPEHSGTPSADATKEPGSSDGSPVPASTPQSREDVNRDLTDALSEIDKQFSVAEALRALELLDAQNQRKLDAIGDANRASRAPPDD
jgi:Ca-activated chloride channel family protein